MRATPRCGRRRRGSDGGRDDLLRRVRRVDCSRRPDRARDWLHLRGRQPRPTVIDTLMLIDLLLRVLLIVIGCGLLLALVWLAALMFESLAMDEWL